MNEKVVSCPFHPVVAVGGLVYRSERSSQAAALQVPVTGRDEMSDLEGIWPILVRVRRTLILP